MSPKPTVQILLTSPTVLAPGDHVTGKLIVDVVEETFELTGIYVELRAREYSYVDIQDGRNNRRRVTMFFHHVQMHQTVFGASKESGKRGGVMLSPGHYEYPFDLQVPYGAPPSYTEMMREGGSRIRYKMRGVLSVPLNRSIRQKIHLTVVPVVSFEQAQFAREHTLTSPEVEVPVTHMLGLSTSKTQLMRMRLQLCPSVVVLGTAVADEYYAQQRQVSQGGGTVVMGKSLCERGGSDDDKDSDSDDDVKKDKASKDEEGEKDEAKVSKSDALPGKLLRSYLNGEDSDFPLQPRNNAPGVVTARVVIENHTKDKFKSFEVLLRQVRIITVRGHSRSDEVSLSKLVVDLPKDQPCKPGDRIAVDVELPMRREFPYNEKAFTNLFFANYGPLRRKPCPCITTQAFSCQNVIEVKFPKISLKKDLEQFPRCVQVAEVVGVPGAPYIPLPPECTMTLTLPPEQ